MNTSIMAERQAKAIQALQEQVARLGGAFALPTQRAPNPGVKHVLTLEALAAALAGIEPPAAPAAAESVPGEGDAPAPKAKRGKG